MDNMRIKKVLESGDVERFHNCVGVTKQKLSEHQWGVAIIVQHIHPAASKELILAALTHDVAELVTGDIPATVKWDNPELKGALGSIELKAETSFGVISNLSAEEHSILKLADCLEGMNYCLNRRLCGETRAKDVFDKWVGFLEKPNSIILLSHESVRIAATTMFNILIGKMERADGRK